VNPQSRPHRPRLPLPAQYPLNHAH
jgi:hypothetical protein